MLTIVILIQLVVIISIVVYANQLSAQSDWHREQNEDLKLTVVRLSQELADLRK